MARTRENWPVALRLLLLLAQTLTTLSVPSFLASHNWDAPSSSMASIFEMASAACRGVTLSAFAAAHPSRSSDARYLSP